ncbi:hypothetical protein J6S35_00450 [Candidatus Saccharibacteria bacterium]|nr:hypothetical protein [Candidatus Saccharibacteria bacterium]
MSYVTDGTFWFTIIFVLVIIGTLWYTVEKKINKHTEALNESLKIREDMLSDVLYLIGTSYEIMGIIEKHLGKKGETEIEEFFSKKEEKFNDIIKKYKL